MKFLVFTSLIFMSFAALAKDINTTISDIEAQRLAQCHETNRTISFCLNNTCLSYVTFQCMENTGNFKVRLKVLTTTTASGDYKETVKKVIYIK